MVASAAGPAAVSHGEHDSGNCHDSASTEDHHGHSESHQGHTSGPTARGALLPESGAMRGGISATHDPLCSHCMGRPDAPPSSSFERQYGPAKKGGEDAAPHAPVQILAPVAAFVRQIAPAQHAPPGSSDRHLLLLNVFRI
jgi:hypothetical protein